MSAKIACAAALLLGVATTVGLGALRGGPPDQPPPARPAADLDRFRALAPADRLKLVEKLAAADAPFAAATRGDLFATIVERGSVEPVNAADVICRVKAPDKASSVATTIKWVIDDGSLVRKGDRVVLLDDAAVRDRLQTATGKAKEADAALIRAAEVVGQTREDNAVEVRLAEIDVKLAEAELTDPAAGKKVVLELKVEQAKLKLERARSRAKGQLATAEAEKQAKSAARDLEARRQQDLEAEVKLCELTAPADGLVMYPAPAAGRFGGWPAPVEPGASVREGQKILAVIDLKQLAVSTRVPEAVVSTVRPGQAVRVRIDAFPDRPLTGKVTHVSPVASAADWKAADVKLYPVTIAFEEVPAGLKPMMSAEVRIVTAERKGVVRVPIRAVVGAGRDRVCFVKAGAEVVERKVVLGAADATFVEVAGGLKEGDLVLTDPPALLGRPDAAKGGR